MRVQRIERKDGQRSWTIVWPEGTLHAEADRFLCEKAQVSVAAVARRANVSRTFLYDNAEARSAVATAMAEAGDRRTQLLADGDDEREATGHERALNAEEGLKAAQPRSSPSAPASANSSAGP
ncbi:hypothetical protein ACWC2K_38605 [Streptomyces chattanoogensis]